MANATDVVVPVVGMGVTMGIGSDAHPYTVVEVSADLKRFVVKADDYSRLDRNGPFTESQTYVYTTNEDAPAVVLTLRKNGRYSRRGEPMYGSSRWYVGNRRAYRDPSF